MRPTLQVLTNIIINKYFSSYHCTFFFIENGNSYTVMNRAAVVYNITDNTIIYNINGDEQEDLFFKISHFCEGFVIESSNPLLVFNYIEDRLNYTKSGNRYNRRKYLFLPAEYNQSNMHEVFKSHHLEKVPEILIVTPKSHTQDSLYYCDNDIVYDLWTHSYIGQTNNEAMFLDRWYIKNCSFLIGKELYPNKLTNQMGKIMRIDGFTFYPFVMLGSSLETSTGVDIHIMKQYARRHNATLVLITEEQSVRWIGIMAKVLNGFVDVGLDAYYYHEETWEIYQMTTPYMYLEAMALVPKPKLLNTWSTPMSPFTLNLWVLIGGMIIFAATAIYFDFYQSLNLKHKKSKKYVYVTRSYFMILGCLLLQPVPSQNTSRRIVICIMVYSMLLSVFYNTKYSSFMVVPRYEPPISKRNDIIKSNVQIGTTTISHFLFPLIENVELMSHFFEEPEESLCTHFASGNIGVVIDNIGRISMKENITCRLTTIAHQPLAEPLFESAYRMLVAKHSPLLPNLDRLLLHMLQGGHIVHWYEEALIIHYTERLKLKYVSQSDGRVVQLAVSQIMGAFILLLAGLVLSTVVFVLELNRRCVV